ncbi:MAG: carbohydrate-binding domain-containing protein [Clostridia bacterium]|nr:carbohydrate-binding domain-containing protein [Clostridia bacterium]
MKRTACLLLILMISLCTAYAADSDERFSNRDFEIEYSERKSTVIELAGDRILCDAEAVTVSGTTATITAEGTYILLGTLDDGMIIVDADKEEKVQLVLDGASIRSATSAPIYIRQADKVFITTAKDTVNTLSCGESFVAIDENEIDAVIFSKEDLTLNGAGTLTVTSPAGHGVVSKDSLRITSGVYEITCASHALSAKDDVSIAGGTFTMSAGKDGIQADNADDAALGFVYISGGTFTIMAEGDGIDASAYVLLEGGTFSITAGGGSANGTKASSDSWGFMGGGRGGRGGWGGSTSTEADGTSMKGVKGTDVTINGGTFTINSADDAIHANASAAVNGGTFDIATGDDAFHAEDTLTVAGGVIRVSESYEGLEAWHVIVSDGDISLVCSDDGVNAAGGTDESGTGGRDAMFGGGWGGRGPGGMMSANSDGSIEITGGTLYVESSGDGMDANGTLAISGGYTIVTGPTSGDTATLDYDISATITGGTFIGTGASGMAQTFSDATQGVIAVSVGRRGAGAAITLRDSAGNTIMEHTPGLSFAVVILSSPEIVSGQTYNITVGSASGDIEAY